MAPTQPIETPTVSQTEDVEAPAAALIAAGPIAEGQDPQYPPIPPMNVQQPPQQQANYYQQQQQPGKADYPPPGYPQQQQQQQYASQPPAMGAPAGGRPSYVTGIPVVGRYFTNQHDNYQGPNSKSLTCLAWGLFVLGFFFPFAWLACILLSCCVRGHPSVRKAALASSIASIITFIVAAIVIPSIMTSSAYRNNNNNNNSTNSRNGFNNNQNFNNNNQNFNGRRFF